MIAAARIALRYFMVHPVQRWLLPVGALFCGAGLLLYVTGRPGIRMFAIGLVAVHLPAALVAGATFRDLSACATNGLAPHFRIRMLGSLLLAAAGIALTWHLLTPLWLRAADPAGLARAATLILPFGAATLLVLGTVIGSASATAFLAVFATTSGLSYWLLADGVAQIRGAGIEPILLAAVAAVGAWGGFGAWYLSTPRIAPPGWRAVPGPFGASQADSAPPTVSSAEASYLTGMAAANAPGGDPDARTTLMYAPLVLAAGWLFARLLPDPISASPGRLSYLVAIMGGILVLQMGAQAGHEARRARLLWLTHATREDVFRLCERRALRQAVWVSTFYAVFLGAWLLQVFGPAGVVWTAALMPATASAGSYLGLMAIRGWRPLDVALGCALLLTVYGVTPFVLAHLEDAPRAPAAALAILLAIALTCRTIAARRWRRIDWLGLRPLRWLGGYASPSRSGHRSA